MSGLQYFLHRAIVKPVLQIYLKQNRKARFDGFRLLIRRGVFHPLLFFSTKLLYDFLENKKLDGVSFLELGCGSGLLSLLAHRKNARVTSVDIDEEAVKCTMVNFEMNFGRDHGATILVSDLLASISDQRFDFVVINPPYYFKEVQHQQQLAWYCGANGEYFHKLFSSLAQHLSTNAEVYMCLEEKCETERIMKIADQYGAKLSVILSRQMKWEVSTIYKLSYDMPHKD